MVALPPGTPYWSVAYGAAESGDEAHAIAVDPDGDLFVAGQFHQGLSFGGPVLADDGWTQLFLAKFASDGTPLWSFSVGGAEFERVHSLSADGAGNVVLSGAFSGTASFGGAVVTAASDRDFFVSKYAPDGTHMWDRVFSADTINQYGRAAAGADGAVALVGVFGNVLDTAGPVLVANGPNDVFVVGLAPDGTTTWARGFGGPAYDVAGSVAIGPDGVIVATGITLGDVDFGGGVRPGTGAGDLFLAEWSAAGEHVWSHTHGRTSTFPDFEGAGGAFVALDSSGVATVLGSFSHTVDLGGGPLSTDEYSQAFLAQYGPDGAFLWARVVGEPSPFFYSMAVDAAGDILVSGAFYGVTVLDGTVLDASSGNDALLARFDAAGSIVWAASYGGVMATANAWALAPDAARDVFLAGEFTYALDLGLGPLPWTTGNDLFLAKLAP